MHYIDHSSADTSGTNAQFTEGNVGTGVAATVVTDDWLNDVQNNILYVSEIAETTTTKGDRTDLHTAIVAVITSTVGALGNTVDSVNAPLTGDGSGATPLDIDFGTMTAADLLALANAMVADAAAKTNLTVGLDPTTSTTLGVVRLSTNAEALTGTATDIAVTPAGLAAAITANGQRPIATQAEAIAGTDDTTIITPLKLRDGSPMIVENTTINVPGDYATIVDAMTFLRGWRIKPDVTVTISVAAGTYTHTSQIPGHPDGQRIDITGAALAGAVPTAGEFSVTGNSVPVRAADTVTNEAFLRGRFSVIVENDTSRGVYLDNEFLGTVSNILFVSNVVTSNAIELIGSAQVTLENVAVCRFGQCLNITDGSSAAVTNWVGVGGTTGVQIVGGGSFNCTSSVICLSNSSAGVIVQRGGSFNCGASEFSGNGLYGVFVSESGSSFATSGSSFDNNGDQGLVANGAASATAGACSFSNNTLFNVTANYNASIDISSSTISGGLVGVYAVFGGFILAQSCTTSGVTSSMVQASVGGIVDCANLIADGGGVTTYGLLSVFGGVINAEGSNVQNCFIGADVTDNSEVIADSSVFSNNTNYGLNVQKGGYMRCLDATISANGVFDILTNGHGYVRAEGAIGLVLTSPAVNTEGNISSYIEV